MVLAGFKFGDWMTLEVVAPEIFLPIAFHHEIARAYIDMLVRIVTSQSLSNEINLLLYLIQYCHIGNRM